MMKRTKLGFGLEFGLRLKIFRLVSLQPVSGSTIFAAQSVYRLKKPVLDLTAAGIVETKFTDSIKMTTFQRSFPGS